MKTVLVILSLRLLSGGLLGGETSVEVLSVKSGTLESMESPKLGYIFRFSTGEVENYPAPPGGAPTVELPKGIYWGVETSVPSLAEIGFRLSDGFEFIYRTERKQISIIDALERIGADHHGTKLIGHILKSDGGAAFVVNDGERTEVNRIEMKVDGRWRMLWMPAKPNAKPLPVYPGPLGGDPKPAPEKSEIRK